MEFPVEISMDHIKLVKKNEQLPCKILENTEAREIMSNVMKLSKYDVYPFVPL